MVRDEWSNAEDRLLVAAVSRWGARNWKLVANEVVSRNSTQCQQRWNIALRPGLNKGLWSPQEDALLIALVGEVGTNWPQVAARWCNHCSLHPPSLTGSRPRRRRSARGR